MNANRRSWTQWTLMALAACLAIFVWEALSDEPPAADRPHKVPIAVVDIARVYKEHREFNAQMLEVKGQIEDFEKEVRKKQAEIQALTPADPGSAQTSGTDAEQASKLSAALQAEVAAKRAEFLNIEARIYFEIYQAIERQTTQICRERDIGIVVRMNGDKMNPADRASVLQGVNRAVVYVNVPDLTDDLLKAFNG